MDDVTDSQAKPHLADIDTLSYEAARDELVSIVAKLERGAATLEESLSLWERGEALAARSEWWLLGARKRLDEARARASAREAGTAGGAGEDIQGNAL